MVDIPIPRINPLRAQPITGTETPIAAAAPAPAPVDAPPPRLRPPPASVAPAPAPAEEWPGTLVKPAEPATADTEWPGTLVATPRGKVPPTSIGNVAVEGGKAFARDTVKTLAAAPLKGAAAVPVLVREGAHEGDIAAIDILDRIERGERPQDITTPDADYRWGYFLRMSPEERAAERSRLKAEVESFTPTDIRENPLYQAGQWVESTADEYIPVAPGWEDSVTVMLGGGLGSVAGGLGAYAIGGPLAAGTVFTLGGSGEAIDRAVQWDDAEKAAGRAGLTPQQIAVSGIMGTAAGATDLLPIETALGVLKIPTPFRRPIAQAIGRIGGQAFIEGGQEAAQQVIQNAIQQTYDENQGLLDGTGPNAAAGAGVGGIVQGIFEIAMPGRHRGTSASTGVSPEEAQQLAQEAADAGQQADGSGSTTVTIDGQTATSEGAPPAAQPAEAVPEAPAAPEPGVITPAPRDPAAVETLRQYGFTDADIDMMGDAEFAAEVEEARRMNPAGVTPPVAPAQPQPAPAPPSAGTEQPPAPSAVAVEPPVAPSPAAAQDDFDAAFDSALDGQFGAKPAEPATPVVEPTPAPVARSPRYQEAVDLVRGGAKANTSTLQRKLKVPYAEAARVLDEMEAAGVVSPANARGGRTVLPIPGIAAAPVRVETAADVEKAGAVVAPEPTPAQREAGNYQMGHAKLYGLDISIETPKGGTREGPDGSWRTENMPAAYGYARRTKEGRDGKLDFFIGDAPDSPVAYIIDQRDLKTGAFDEHKVIAAVPDEATARAIYERSYSDWRGRERIGAITEIPAADLKAWSETYDPASPYSPSFSAAPTMATPSAKPRKARKVRTKEGKPHDILSFLISIGGLKPTPEWRAMNAHRLRPGLLNNKGKTPDQAREAAAEAGFFGGNPADDVANTTPADLEGLVDSALRGEKIYAPQDAEWAAELQQDSKNQKWREEVEHRLESFIAEYGYELDAETREQALNLAVDGREVEDALEIAIMAQEEQDTADLPPEYQIKSEEFPGWEWPTDEELAIAMAQEGEPLGPGGESYLESEGGESSPERAARGEDGGATPRAEEVEPTTEAGADGKPQTVLPGAERISDASLAQRRADAPLKPKADQKAADIGLFSDDSKQTDLLDMVKAAPKKEPTPAPPADDFDSVFDAAVDQQFGAKKAAVSAVKHTAMGIADVAKGLDALFSPKGKLGSGPTFDEETYRKALPFFKAGAAHFGEAGRDVRAMVRELVRYLAETAGMAREAIEGMRPYIRRFVEDVESGKETLDAPSAREGLERDRGDAAAQDGVGEADVPAPAGGDGRGARARGAPDREEGGAASRRRVPQGHAPAMGEGGHLEIPPREPGDLGGTPPDRNGQRGRIDGGEGLFADHPAEATAVGPAPNRADLNAKRLAQAEAEKVPVKFGDRANIDATLPFLYPAQRDDIYLAEKRFAEHPGMLFTHGTGTGKSYLALGTAKRFMRSGAKNVLIIEPSQGLLLDMEKKARDLQLKANILPDKSSRPAGGLVMTTYANLQDNPNLARVAWDLIIADESQKLSSNESGEATLALNAFRALTMHPRGFQRRAEMVLAREWAEIEKYRKDSPQRVEAYQRWKEKADPLKAEWAAIPRNERPKALFLSATPFPYHFSLDYAEGYLFDYPPAGDGRGYNSATGKNAWFVQNLGYRMRYNKLTKPDVDVAGDVMERELHERLKRDGALTGRRLEVEHDYDRKFVLVDDPIGKRIDEVIDFMLNAEDGRFRALHDVVGKRFDYLSRMRLLEAIKAKQAIPHIRKQHALGRKVVVFHHYNEGGGFNPFDLEFSPQTTLPTRVNGKLTSIKARDLYAEFLAKNPDVAKMKFSDYGAPIEEMRAAFGDGALIYNGTIPNKKRDAAKARFNDDGPNGANLIVVQADAGEFGISLHDTTGKAQRVIYNLGIPVKPTTAIQEEGRIYRDGQASNAMFRYLNTGTNWERWTFAGKMAERSGTAENLGLGNMARGLRQSFVDAYNESDHETPGADPDEGTGGKERDRMLAPSVSEFERAKSHYFAQQKGRKEHLGKDYFATPEPLGLKMVGWANIKRGESVLEPSAGHGAIARYFPDDAHRTVVEPSSELASRTALVTPGARVVVSTFEDLHISNKYHAIVMNPPFGTGGKTAMEHVAKAAQHLANGGRIVAIIPTGPAADKRFEDALPSLVKNHIYPVATIPLPAATFERAGTSVRANVVILEKQTDKATAAMMPVTPTVYDDVKGAEDISAFFDGIEAMEMPPRTPPITAEVVAAPPKEAIADASVAATAPAAESTPAAPATNLPNLRFETSEGIHGKTGKPIARAAMRTRVDRGIYDKVNARAKAHGGYYSTYDRAFLFPSPEKRAAFMAEFGEENSRPPLHEMNPEAEGAARPLASMPPRTARTESEAFRRWFGDSKVVNADGTPMVVYHGTATRADFDTFSRTDDGGYHFGTAAAASERADVSSLEMPQRVMPVYLAIKNPLTVEDQGGWEAWSDVIDRAKRQGYDGIRYRNVEEDAGSESWIAFRPEQIKSVANRGTFDPANPSILASMSPGVPEINLSPEHAEALVNDMRETVRRIAGDGVRVDLFARLPKRAFDHEAPYAWQEDGYGADAEELYGVYYPRAEGLAVEPTIFLALAAPGARSTAGHEAYHHVQTLFTDAERQMMAADLARGTESVIRRLAAAERPTDWRTLPPIELEAYAFERYRQMRENGQDGYGLHVAIRRAWDRLLAVLRAVRASLNGRGYRSVDAIFQAAETGRMAKRDARAGNGAAFSVAPSLRSEAFQKWFGQSKVVDGLGQPLVVYHGSPDARGIEDGFRSNRERFLGIENDPERAFFFTDRQSVARTYAVDTRAFDYQNAEPRVIPAYLSIQNPLVIDAAGATWRNNNAIDQAIAAGHDGVIIRNVRDTYNADEGRSPSTVYVAFNPTQIKSPQNVGTFDPANPSMLAAMPPRTVAGTPPAAGAAPPMSAPRARIERALSRARNIWDDAFVRMAQDQDVWVERVQQEIEAAVGAPLGEPLDVYLSSTLYSGRSGERMIDLRQKWLEPFIEKMRGVQGPGVEVTREEIDEYLYALHAKERNDFIRHNRDPSNDEGSGMTDDEADAIIARVQNDQRAAVFDDLAADVRKLVRDTRMTLLRSGLIDQDTFDRWEAQYQHYVPLRGWEVTDSANEEGPRIGRGFSVRGKEAKAALGRRSRSDSPIAYALLQAQQAVIRSEKNRVGKSLLRLIHAHPNPKLWEVTNGRMVKVLDKRTGLTTKVWQHPSADWTNDKLFGVKVGGKQVFIDIHHPRFRRAMQRQGAAGIGMGNALVRFMSRIMRLYAALRTQFNPEFIYNNFFKDIDTAMINVGSVKGRPKWIRLKALKITGSALREIFLALRNPSRNTHMAQMWNEYRLAGGKVSFLEWNNVDDIKRGLERDLRQGDYFRFFRALGRLVGDMNTAVENALRLAVYIRLREGGQNTPPLSQDRAAQEAKELTVNFNRHGELGPLVNMLYVFANASIQGTFRMFKGMARSKTVRRVVAGLVVYGALQNLINSMLSDDDENGKNLYDQIPYWDKERSFILMLPGTDGLHIKKPQAYGYNVPVMLGDQLMSVIRGIVSPEEAAANLFGTAASSFNPIGSEGTFLQMIAPTLIDPLIQINEGDRGATWYGGPLYPAKYDQRKPDSENFGPRDPQWAIDMARGLNRITGGNVGKKGYVDITPAVIDLWADFLGGGVSGFISNAAETMSGVAGAATGTRDLPDISNVPFARRVIGDADSRPQLWNRFYEAWDRADGANYEVQQLTKAGQDDEAAQAEERNEANLELFGVLKPIKNRLDKLRQQKRKIEGDRDLTPQERQTEIAEIEAEEQELLLDALGQVP